MRAAVLLIAALCLAGAAWGATRAREPAAPSAGEPVVVGETRVAAAGLEAAAARTAGRRPRKLAAARRTAADRAIERLWLTGEAADAKPASGRRPSRAAIQVADALAGERPAPARFAVAFDGFHARWRARTRCLPEYRDPYADRCGDAAPAAAGHCRWMGEATLCELRPGVRRRWLVVSPAAASPASARARGRSPGRARLPGRPRRAGAGGGGRAAPPGARPSAPAPPASAKPSRPGSRASARRRPATARRGGANRSSPARCSRPARAACARQLRDSDPYLFGFGMQDVVGQAEGLIAARTALTEQLAAAAGDEIDRGKLQPLLDAVAAGNRELVRMARADPDKVAAFVARFDAHVEAERAISRPLGLGDCLARPPARAVSG